MQTAISANPSSQIARSAERLRRRIAVATILIAIAGGALRVMTVHRPLNHQLANSWREADYVQIARNFDREGMNILYPRIDWRGETPGFVEMEFPLTPWLAAAGYRLFGYHEQILRMVSAAFSLIAMLLFYAVARDALSRVGALIAFSAFAFNPLLVRLSGSMQPEPLMIACVILTAYHAIRFDRNGTTRSLMLAAAATAVAGLAKAPGVYVGAILAYVCLRRYGLNALARPTVWFAAAIAVTPVYLWYAWASQFWITYGNSLGVSNESHWITTRLLWPPTFLRGNLITEFILVWSPIGWGLGIVAMQKSRRRGAARIAAIWYTAAWIFFLAAAGTSGDNWALYYHCISVPPACLLIGLGAVAVRGRRMPGQSGRQNVTPRRLSPRRCAVTAVMLTLIALAGTTYFRIHSRDHAEDLKQLHDCAMQIAPLLPVDKQIVVRGGRSVDEFGSPVAFNEPMLFAWLDRRGFNYPKDKLDAAALAELTRQGGDYWIARPDELEESDAHGPLNSLYTTRGACSCGNLVVLDLHAAFQSDGAGPSLNSAANSTSE